MNHAWFKPLVKQPNRVITKCDKDHEYVAETLTDSKGTLALVICRKGEVTESKLARLRNLITKELHYRQVNVAFSFKAMGCKWWYCPTTERYGDRII